MSGAPSNDTRSSAIERDSEIASGVVFSDQLPNKLLSVSCGERSGWPEAVE